MMARMRPPIAAASLCSRKGPRSSSGSSRWPRSADRANDMRLDERLKAFNEKRGALLDEMESLDQAKLVAKPLAGKWSILEIIEHLVIAEREVLQGLPEPSQLSERERRLTHRFRYVIVMLVLRYGIPVQVPSPTMV